MSFLNWFWSFWNWFSSLIRFEDANDSVSISEESTDSPWCGLAIQIQYHRLDTPTDTYRKQGSG